MRLGDQSVLGIKKHISSLLPLSKHKVNSWDYCSISSTKQGDDDVQFHINKINSRHEQCKKVLLAWLWVMMDRSTLPISVLILVQPGENSQPSSWCGAEKYWKYSANKNQLLKESRILCCWLAVEIIGSWEENHLVMIMSLILAVKIQDLLLLVEV